jgi:hypothetical protein
LVAFTAIGASVALAGSTDYFGAVDGGGKVQLRVKKSNGHKRVTRFDFQHVSLKCGRKHEKATGNLSFTAPVRHGEFKIRGQNAQHGTIRINGELRAAGRRTKGTIRLDGAIHVDGRSGFAHDCHSGIEHWAARRG